MNLIVSEGMDYATGKDMSVMNKVLICDTYHIEQLKEYEIKIYKQLFQPINESFYKYNWHDQFREFGISKRDKFKTMRIRRKI